MPQDRQTAAVVRLVTEVLGDDVIGAYPHGSTVLGTLRPTSDLDVLVVCRRATTESQRRALVQGLLDVSGRRARQGPGRPIEVTVVVQSELRPWRYPPPVEFQYGEWLRDDYEAGLTPGPGTEPDVALLVAVALRGGAPLVGPDLREVLDPVPHDDVRRAAVAGVPGLLEDVDDDTRNVLLTLARVWHTLATGRISTKDVAAAWAVERLPADHREAMASAASGYLHEPEYQPWPGDLDEARACAGRLVAEIETAHRAGVEVVAARSTSP